jgi:hypothetical protein
LFATVNTLLFTTTTTTNSQITSEFYTTAMPVIIDLPIFHIEFEGMFNMYPHTKFQMPNSNSLSVIAIEQKAKCIFHADDLKILNYIFTFTILSSLIKGITKYDTAASTFHTKFHQTGKLVKKFREGATQTHIHTQAAW